MRIWDINPGYLNRQSLLGEHRELHGMVSVIVNGKKGYSRHPETLRWIGHGWALHRRHQLLRCEMALRGYRDKTPVEPGDNPGNWPSSYIDSPFDQFEILKQKYARKEEGRIPLPQNAQQLWSQHKYSVLARDPAIYRQIGHDLARNQIGIPELAQQLVELLKTTPTDGGIRNAAQHMWGYVAKYRIESADVDTFSIRELLQQTQQLVLNTHEPYLLASTALSELLSFLPE